MFPSRSLLSLVLLVFQFVPSSALQERDEKISIRIGLTNSDMRGLEKRIHDISTPGSSEYGNWLSKKEVESYTLPTDSTVSTVTSWLASHGVSASDATISNDWMTIKVTPAQADALFPTEALATRDISAGSPKYSVSSFKSYVIPEAVKDHTTVIYPLVSSVNQEAQKTKRDTVLKETIYVYPTFASVLPRQTPGNTSTLPESCIATKDKEGWRNPYTLTCRFDYYQIPRTPATQPKEKNQLWLSGYDNLFVYKKWVKEYMVEFRPDMPALANFTFDLVTIDGGLNNQLPAGESDATLNSRLMWTAASTANNVPTTFMSIGTDESGEPVDWLISQAEYLLAMENPPNVVILGTEQRESLVDKDLAVKLCNSYAQLAARGVTLISHVWYGGVSAAGIQFTGDETNCKAGDKFDVTFPATCPYVTSVGGSSLSDGIAETAVPGGQDWISNAGGWSSVFARPDFQENSVSSYLNAWGDVHKGLFNASGRATPDVALIEDIDAGSNGLPAAFATAAHSAALLAGMIAMLNDELITAGKSTMGFLNPWIYEHQDVFADIVKGSNPGCGTRGFNATAGWDPVSGVGSPSYTKLRQAVGLSAQ